MRAAGSLHPQEKESFDRLFRTVTRSPRFSLTFAVVNSPVQGDRLLQALTERLAPERQVVPVRLERSTAPGAPDTLLGEVARHLEGGGVPGKQVLCALGIERGFGEPKTADRILSSLNRQREQFSRRLNVPLVLWLPEFALERIAHEAPDFWAWRSGVFTFPEDLTTIKLPAGDQVILPADLANLTAEEKRRRIAANRDLLRSLGTGTNVAGGAAAIELEIAQLHRILGEIEDAVGAFREAERLAHAAGDTRRMLEAAAAVEELTGGRAEKAAPEPLPVSAGQPIPAAVTPGTDFGTERKAGPLFTDLVVRVYPSSGSRYAIHVDENVSHEVDLATLTRRPTAILKERPDGLRSFGKRLTETLFRPGTPSEKAWKRFCDSTPAGQGRLVLDLEGPGAVIVPWEYALHPHGWLISLDYEMVRRVGLRAQAPARALTTPRGPVRVLIVESDPLLYPGSSQEVPSRIDVAKETEELVAALGKTGRQYVVRRVIPSTIKVLHLDLARQGVAIVHFNGHGLADPEPALCFEDETGRLDPVSASEFVPRTSGQGWLVVLSACFSAAASGSGTLAMAHALAKAGVPWVVGMQDVVPVGDARIFSEVFYRYLAEGHPVWEAVRQARVELGYAYPVGSVYPNGLGCIHPPR